MDTKDQILAILKEVKPIKNLENVSDIIEGGYIDSFELMSIIACFSDRFGIEISVEDLVPENFNSVDAMTQMVDRLINNK
ncbi:MAG: acyl carrier protein [Bacteroidales bacterium]|nr:acyl carrier protein [Bacteroidales bacterium]